MIARLRQRSQNEQTEPKANVEHSPERETESPRSTPPSPSHERHTAMRSACYTPGPTILSPMHRVSSTCNRGSCAALPSASPQCRERLSSFRCGLHLASPFTQRCVSPNSCEGTSPDSPVA